MYTPYRSAQRLVPELRINRYGYREVWDRQKQRYVGEHRHTFERTYGPIPPGFEVHHIDFDRLNNSPNNLIALPKTEHQRLHRLHEQLESIEYDLERTSLLQPIRRAKLNRQANKLEDEISRVIEDAERYRDR